MSRRTMETVKALDKSKEFLLGNIWTEKGAEMDKGNARWEFQNSKEKNIRRALPGVTAWN